MELPPSVRTILSVLRENGFRAYVVGGCVRDACMGLAPHDFDVATDASPAQVQAAFGDQRVLETGIRHGTVTVLIGHEPFEVTTFRIDGDYSDHRHPNDVTFTSCIEDDLARRDFTVNAMAYDGETLVDPFGGQADAARRVLRCVGEANLRFREDGLRILRALRFAAVLDFSVEPDTAAAVHGNRELLAKIAVERLYAELRKLLGGVNAPAVLREYADVIRVFLPEVSDAGLLSLDRTNADTLLRLALLLADADAETALRRLHADNKTIRAVTQLLTVQRAPVRRMLSSFSPQIVHAFWDLSFARGEIGDTERDRLHLATDEVLRQAPCLAVRDLAVNGKDLENAGLRGVQVGQALRRLLDAVLDDAVPNEKEALLQMVQNNRS